jgi:hypothetical protein
MLRFPRHRPLPVWANTLLLTVALPLVSSSAVYAAPQHQTVQTETSSSGQTMSQQQLNELPLPSNDYGAGAYRLFTLTPGGLTAKWQDFDAMKNLREDDIFQYTTTPVGTSVRTEEQRDYFNDRGTIGEQTISKWNINGALSSYEFKSFDYRGDLTSDHLTKYDLNLHVDYNWNPYLDKWDTTTIPDKPTTTPNATPAPAGGIAPVLPLNQPIGFLFPRDYRPGDLITGSAWKPDYAEAFRSVPGFAEYTQPIQTYNFANGTPNWSGLEIGVKGYGYAPVGPNGYFSLRVPLDYNYKNGLQFQVRQDDAPPASAGAYAQFGIDPPVAAPDIPQSLQLAHVGYSLARSKTDYLIDLWNEAYDLELEWSDADDDGAPWWVMSEIDDDLHDVYREIDFVTSQLPKGVATDLAHQLARETRELNDVFVAANPNGLTEDQKDELSEYQGWASFLDGEAEETDGLKWIRYSLPDEAPYWTSPVLPQNRLGAVRGQFSGYGYNDELHVDGVNLNPIVETPRCFYFMPTDGLSVGLHNFQVGGYGVPQTILPVFYLYLNMWADDTDLHKGQKTTYHLSLTGLNGLLSSAWGSSFYASDLMSPSDLLGGVPDAGSPGTITLTITNETPGVISMKNVFTLLNAQSFGPLGTFQINGGVGAILDGNFNILGIARSFLQPEWAWGPGLGSIAMTLNTDGQSNGQAAGSSATYSTAPNADSSPCNLSDPPPATLLPLGSLYLKSCMGPDTASIFNDALNASGGANSATVESPPYKPSQDGAENRVAAAEQAAKDWKARCDVESKHASDAWMAGFNTIPQSFKDAMAKTANDDYHAATDERGARDSYSMSPTDANKAKLDAAKAKSAATHEAYTAAGDAAEGQFTAEQRAAWENANNEWKSAEYYRAQAEQELRDAREALHRQFPLQSSLRYLF